MDSIELVENGRHGSKTADPYTRNESKRRNNETDVFLEDDNQPIYRDGSKKAILKHKPSKGSVYHQEFEKGTASFPLSVFNLMNAVLGSGILGLAFAMAQLGYVLFFIFLTIVAAFALFAIHLLLIMCDKTGVKAYEKLGREAYGFPGLVVAASCIVLQNTGAMCSYMFIIKYELPNVLMTLLGMHEPDGSWYLNGDYLVVFVTFLVIIPLATFKNIGFLGYTSGFSIFCMFFFTGVVMAKKFVVPCPLDSRVLLNETDNSSSSSLATTAGMNISHEEDEFEEFYLNKGPQQCQAKAVSLTNKWAYSIPMMMFSFVCHTAVLPIYAELKRPSAARMQKVANTSLGLCYTLYSLASLFGYLTFYNWINSEMLLMYNYTNPGDVLTLIVRLTVLIAVVLTVPLIHFPARKAVTFLLFPKRPFSWFIHIGVMMFFMVMINIFVVFVPDIKEVFGVIGATSSTMLVFVLPSVFYLKLDEAPIKTPKKIFAVVTIVCGIILMLESLTIIVLGYFN